MKIAYFLDMSEGFGGAGNVLLEQAKIMSSIYEVRVVIPCNKEGKSNSEYQRRCEEFGLKSEGIYYSTTYSFQYIDIVEALSSMNDIKEFAIRENIDLFHSVQLNVAVELVAREMGIPHLMNVYQLEESEFQIAYEDIFPKYHSCDSLLYCNIWRKMLGVESRCIRPALQNCDLHKKNLILKDEVKVLMLGSICERKNQLEAIKAISLCNAQNKKIRLIIAGDKQTLYAEKCEQYIIQNHMENSIKLLGFQENSFSLLDECDVFLCTSTDESFPSSIVEAMTYDLTIVSTPVAGIPELLRNKENAYISAGFVSEDIADSIMECLRGYEDGTIYDIHENASETWEENFSCEAVRKQLKNYYRDILSQYEKPLKENIRQIYQMQIDAFKAERLNCIETDIVKKRIYYYIYLSKKLKEGSAYIWGAGKFGKSAKQLLEILFPDINVIAFIDKVKRGYYLETVIIEPEDVKPEKVDYIFLGFDGEKMNVIKFLENRGYLYNENVWLLP